MTRLWKKVFQIVLFSSVALVADTDLKNPFLWEVNKGVEKFYLFGTIHLADPKLSTLPNVVKEAIDKSDEVRTEVPMDADLQMKSAMHMMRHDGKSLKTLLKPTLYTKAEMYLKSINPQLSILPFEKYEGMGTLYGHYDVGKSDENPTIQALDSNIYNSAKEFGKGVGGVETIEEQILAMDTFTLDEQIDDLDATLDYLTKNRDFMERMKNAYIEGNSKKMMAFLEETMFKVDKFREMEEKFMQVMLYDRNTKMTTRILENIKVNAHRVHFFAFGVMHFLGEKSILSELKDKGYSVRRMK